MVALRWSNFEDQVRDIASSVFGKACHTENIAGVAFDGVIDEAEDRKIVVEISVRKDLNKVREGIVRITAAKNALWLKGIYCQGYIVLESDPTQSMLDMAKSAFVKVLSISSFAAILIEYEVYRTDRIRYAFGSAVDPVDGTPDRKQYVPVKYVDKKQNRDYTADQIAELVASGNKIILLGEYGSGKSRCISEVFNILSAQWGLTFRFPFAINLRDAWGARRADDILRRHADAIALDRIKPQIVRAFHRRNSILLLDGFDEIGIQSWTTERDKIIEVRAQAMEGVKELISNSGLGFIVAGREHYFSNRQEMLSALGLDSENVIILHAKEEFTNEELANYFNEVDIDVTFPEWLPRRPLICQTIATLSTDQIEEMFGRGSDETLFWQHFIETLCKRDARIHPALTAKAVYAILIELSRITRLRPSNVGPITQQDLQGAFESALGQRPVGEAAALLQRLPTLGRISAEDADLRFVDVYILDGLRGSFLATIHALDESRRSSILKEPWRNPLQTLGQTILLSAIEPKWNFYEHFSTLASRSQNRTLAADIISSMARSSRTSIDFKGISLSEASFSELDLTKPAISNITIKDSTIEHLVLPSSRPLSVSVIECVIARVGGVSSRSGLPNWVKECSVDEYDSVTTVSRIRNAKLSPSHEILVAIIKKTFFQPGSGRQEEALLRGFAVGPGQRLAPQILNLLMRDGILSRFKGKEGWVYTPERSQAKRMSEMLDQLRSSDDNIWKEVGAL